jgi:hypothetical protein
MLLVPESLFFEEINNFLNIFYSIRLIQPLAASLHFALEEKTFKTFFFGLYSYGKAPRIG